MKFKLLFFSFLVTSLLTAQNTENSHTDLEKIVESFRVAIIDHSDFEKFSDLFLHDSITWAAIVTGNTKKMVLKQKPDFTFKASDYKSFFNTLKEGSEEKFYDVKIDVRNEFATISFDYSFNVNSKVQNWGTEYWSLILVNDTWKITSVTWSQNLEKIDACPFKDENIFKL
ncbi:hypothetical protein [Aquimarina algicola]|uniref:Nuclear transport factor 2 family protein n=1 Tax=Aquimarina algicola TaxID=2589995 RepID=A0A504JC92_9FLAO|nr:hypothetical protein [Aquimarina algicola]TPN85193.1 hypothetical protein FHK87_14285 [Aquimarina algicola]